MNDESLFPLTGHCQCGAIHYQITTPPLITVVCHCVDCQKLSATSFSITMVISAGSFSLLSGELLTWERKADSGARVICFFCGGCGNRIYHLNPDKPELLRFKPGTLDNTDLIRPQAHLWTRSKQEWVQIADTMPQFETQPENLLEFIKHYGSV